MAEDKQMNNTLKQISSKCAGETTYGTHLCYTFEWCHL